MNTKFNLGSVVVRIPSGNDNPEINVSIEDISFEVEDMSLTEYGSVLKTLIVEGTQAIKDIGKAKEEYEKKSHERQKELIELRIKEQETRNARFQEKSFEPASI